MWSEETDTETSRSSSHLFHTYQCDRKPNRYTERKGLSYIHPYYVLFWNINERIKLNWDHKDDSTLCTRCQDLGWVSDFISIVSIGVAIVSLFFPFLYHFWWWILNKQSVEITSVSADYVRKTQSIDNGVIIIHCFVVWIPNFVVGDY